MATDEAILWSVSRGAAPPTLRMYAWDPHCLSLGRTQPVSEVDLDRLQEQGCDLVRRPTGGRAILHTDELTYSVCLHKSDPIANGGVLPAYRRISNALLTGLIEIGLPARNDAIALRGSPARAVCFEQHSHYEITVAGQKLLGSAQWRQGGGMLQHGSLPLRGDIALICNVLVFASESARKQSERRVRQRATTLSSALGCEPEWRNIAEGLAHGFSRSLNVQLQLGELSTDEQQRIGELHTQKYTQPAWTFGKPSVQSHARSQSHTTA